MFGMHSSIFSVFSNTQQTPQTPLVFATHDQKYIVNERKQIVDKLNAIKSKQYLMTGQDPKNAYAFQTIMLKIQSNQIFLDLPSKDDVLTKILALRCIDFYCNFQGVKVRFTAKNPKVTQVKAEKFLTVSLPEAIYWKEDRNTHRVEIPFSHQKTYLVISLKNSNINDKKFQLYDLSSEGFSFINNDPSLSGLFSENTELVGHFFTANYPAIQATFQIKHLGKKSQDNQAVDLIGCHFVKLDLNDESRIQSYIQNIEIRYLLLN
jgi:hypothetical protein